MTKLKPFQLEGVRKIWEFGGRALLADEMGLGKTVQSLFWLLKSRLRPAIIVCPASLKWNWFAEARDHFGIKSHVIEGKRKASRVRFPEDVVIINYDLLKSWLPTLLEFGPECIIFDEISYIKEESSQRSTASRQLAQNCRSVVGLSGTPMTTRPIELWHVLHVIEPKLFPSKSDYAWRYCSPKWDARRGWTYHGATNVAELHGILKGSCLIRRLKKDVLTDLPEKNRTMVRMRLPDYTEYNKAKRNFIGWLRETSPGRAHRASKNIALTKVGYLLRLAADLKMELIIRWIKDFAERRPGQKLVGFSMHTKVLDKLTQTFPGSVLIDGRVSPKNRAIAVSRFQKDPNTHWLFGNTKAAGMGLTLTAAQDLAFFDFPWTPGDLLQGEDRIHRIGQRKETTIHYLVAMGTIEERLAQLLRERAATLDAILNGEMDSEELDVFDQLLKESRHE